MSTLQANRDGRGWSLNQSSLTVDECMMYARIISQKFAFATVQASCIVADIDDELVRQCTSLARPAISTHHLIVGVNYDEIQFEMRRLEAVRTLDVDKINGVCIYSSQECARWVTPIFQVHELWRN